MSIEIKQHLKMTQQLVMTPQLQQAIKLLQLSRMELVDLIRTELTENPLLEDPVKGEEGANEIDWDQYLDHYQLQGHTAPSNRGLTDEELPGYEATLTKKTDL